MKVLFVSSGNSKNGVSPIIKSQAESLMKQGVSISHYLIRGKGVFGYLKNILPIKKIIKKGGYDVIHAHYSMSAFIATFAGSNPLVVSLMGSDVKSDKYFKIFIKIFKKISWIKTIVKSEDMKKSLKIDDVVVLPNGVDINFFKNHDRNDALKKTSWNPDKRHVLFAANPLRPEKNFKLAKEAMKLLKTPGTELHYLEDVPHERMPCLLNAADLVLLTSKYEGSPNVIKEAMACNAPIVSTNVGDVDWLLRGLNGCYVASDSPVDLASAIDASLAFSVESRSTKGIDQIMELQLDSQSVAKKMTALYKEVIYLNN
jgi:glycosyltransferase involved in cell wall biosynthesis